MTQTKSGPGTGPVTRAVGNVYVSGVRREADGGYPVQRVDTHGVIGRVVPVYPPSHIRRGRAQASPWWQALNPAGAPVGEMHQRRVDAAAELAR